MEGATLNKATMEKKYLNKSQTDNSDLGAVSGNEVAIAFAQWITVYASQMGTGWVVMKGVDPTFYTSKQLFDEFKKATDR